MAQRQPLSEASALVAPCYTEPRWLVLEQRGIFARSWQLLGHLEQLESTGDYFTYEVADVPPLLVRDTGRILLAFHNVCRHRAGPPAGRLWPRRRGATSWSSITTIARALPSRAPTRSSAILCGRRTWKSALRCSATHNFAVRLGPRREAGVHHFQELLRRDYRALMEIGGA